MIYYVGSFCRQAAQYDLFQFPAASTKMAYILDCLKKEGPCTLVSLAAYKNHQWRFLPSKCLSYDERETDCLMPSIGSPVRLLRGINSFLLPISLFFYGIFHFHKEDTVVSYHSLAYTGVMVLCKKIKKFRMVLEVEEIYSDVRGKAAQRERECRRFQAADAFLFSTQLLDNLINREKKPSIIVHGTYQAEPRLAEPPKDKIRVIYAGTLDSRKGGALVAVSAAAFLDERYEIHIIGFGSEKDKQGLMNYIRSVAEKSKCSVSYDGLKRGEDYLRFLQSGQIGLSTQDPDAAFNATSFPSKILSYLANGLNVVTIRIPAIEASAVGNMLSYYNEQTPEAVATAIRHVNLDAPYNSREKIVQLDRIFQDKLNALLS